MEIPRIEIPQIKIKQIYIPRIRTWEQYPTTLDIIDKPKLDYPVVSYPTFEALQYHPDKFIPTDPVKQPEKPQPEIPSDFDLSNPNLNYDIPQIKTNFNRNIFAEQPDFPVDFSRTDLPSFL